MNRSLFLGLVLLVASPVALGETAIVPFTATVTPADARAVLLARLGADRWHRAGFRGQGVKVAILDSGFRGYREHLGKALPASVVVKSFRADGDLEARDSQHGILCAEIIHAVAPDAELLFANWEPDSPQRFLDAVAWARQQGARLVSCSMIMPGWSDGAGSGPVHAALTGLLGEGARPDDVLCVACAGNIAQRHWSGAFRDVGGWHGWVPGVLGNPLWPWDTGRVLVELVSTGDAHYRIELVDPSGATLSSKPVSVGVSHVNDHATCQAVSFRAEPGKEYRLYLRRVSGSPGWVRVVVLGANLGCFTEKGSLAFPADGPSVLAVGATEADGRRAAYSGCGPDCGCEKPELVAPVPFYSKWRAEPFVGTSAAAPQAAGLAALIWSRYPSLTAAGVRRALCRSALDLGPPGHDPETGHGQARVP